MSTPINLNKVRKDRARAAKRARADNNAVAFGRTKAEKQQSALENSRQTRALDGKALDTPPYGADEDPKTP
ncbi:DUF4169 family protein [uncultured Tateyamaria sp.]|uniref:DUF4169 family protein n=1 Tax=uncultured Tateyamaria sp. TaxID=455651 RepID=UPI002603E167|nr:DUF4169 family protein [uncultured Tateyamaria sp.]